MESTKFFFCGSYNRLPSDFCLALAFWQRYRNAKAILNDTLPCLKGLTLVNDKVCNHTETKGEHIPHLETDLEGSFQSKQWVKYSCHATVFVLEIAKKRLLPNRYFFHKKRAVFLLLSLAFRVFLGVGNFYSSLTRWTKKSDAPRWLHAKCRHLFGCYLDFYLGSLLWNQGASWGKKKHPGSWGSDLSRQSWQMKGPPPGSSCFFLQRSVSIEFLIRWVCWSMYCI